MLFELILTDIRAVNKLEAIQLHHNETVSE